MTDSAFEFGTTPFYFLRHGQTNENREGIVQGQNDTELNTAGRKMAEDAAEALSGVPLASIYASPLKRAWMTASIVSVLTGVPVHALPDLMERHWGKYQGRRKAHRPSADNPATAETVEDFRHRVARAMKAIPGPSPVLVVAHSGVFRAICENVGIRIVGRVAVTSGLVLRFEPPTADRRNWRIIVV